MNSFIIEKVALPLSDLLLGYTISKKLQEHRNYAQYSEKDLKQLQHTKLGYILDHAVASVPAYSQFRNNGKENAQTKLTDFPVLTKMKLQGKERSYISNKYDIENLIKLESSGSSGIKTTVYLTKEEHSVLRAIMINWWEWVGYSLGTPILQTGITPDRGLVKSIKDWITNTIYFDAFGISEKEALTKLKKISKFKKPFLGGFASSLYVLASYAEKNNLDVQFDGVISWGDKMFDHYKEKIESVFKTSVFENYACNEGIMIGQKVEHDYFYIYTPNIYLELLDENDRHVNDGEIGRVIITKLDGFAMPLIRYDTGDLAVKLPRFKYPGKRKFNFPLLQKVIGRNTDIIKTPEGKHLIVHTFTGIFEFYNEIKQFRVIQRKIDSIEIEYICSPTFKEEVLTNLENDIRDRTGSEIGIEWKKVETIPNTNSGKPQLIKNYLIERSLTEVT